MRQAPTTAQIGLWSATAALAGLLFGFDVAVISGAEQAIQTVWALDAVSHGWVLSAALWGTVLGALTGSWPTDRLGRRMTLVIVAALYVVASLGTALASDPLSFAIFRFVGGLAIGISSIAAPAYISEIAPDERRGQLVGLYQLNIVVGILVAFLSNWLISDQFGNDSWRWMLGIQAIPSVIFLIATWMIPESPTWLKRNHENNVGNVPWRAFLNAPLAKPATLAFSIAMFNQLSGINAVIYFAPRIFEASGLGLHTALLASVGIGVTNVVATGAAVLLIDRLGRRTLLLIGGVGYCISLSAISAALATNSGGLVAPFIFLFIASHAIGQGAVIWVFIAEIFPAQARARGQTIGSGTHWIMAALVTLALPPLLAATSPQGIFLFFLLMMMLQMIWIWFCVPETKQKSLSANDLC